MANLSRELKPAIEQGSDNLKTVVEAFRDLGIDVPLAGSYLSAEAHRKGEASRGV